MIDPCEEALIELYGYLDGELTDDRRSTISRHLDDCTTCLGAFDFEVELRQVIVSKCQERVPDSLRSKIAGLLSGEQRSVIRPGE